MLLRRHRMTAAVAAVLSLAVLATTGVSVAQYFRAESERGRAVEALAAAQTQRDHAQHVADFLIDAFTAADPGRGRATEMRAGDLIERAAGVLQNKSATLEPVVYARLAQTLSYLYFRMDSREEAARQAEIARNAMATVADPPVELLSRQDLVEAGVAVLYDKYTKAAELTSRGVERIADPARFGDPELLQQLWELRVRSAIFLGQPAKAIEYIDTVLALLRARPDHRPEQIDWLRQRRAMIVSDSGNYREALAEMQALVAERRAAGRVNDLNHVEILRLLGQSHARVGNYRAALEVYDEALSTHREIRGDNGRDDRVLMHLYGGMASVYANVQRAPESVQMFRRAIDTARAKYGETSTFMASAYFNLADTYQFAIGDPALAEFFYRRAQQATPAEALGNRAIFRRCLAQVLLAEGKLFEAAYELEGAREELRSVYGGRGSQSDAARINLAELSLRRFDLAGASAFVDGSVLAAGRTSAADSDVVVQAERLSAYFDWNRADGSTIAPPLSR
ncbi:tetratricopeptide repeat protein [Tahibacter caeni]|uniref:tetratricopeptide repeat protein n=1 Tax=Tahibacter caeni TaxID=1453545 RepID=UPI0021482698|nr:tetratricopeptide repeat protein [Tahibacter caeni]